MLRRWSHGLVPFVVTFVLITFPALANESAYTKLNLKRDCSFHSEYEAGGSAVCNGYKGFPVHFAEGDLRQMVRFGHLSKTDGQWESFGQFNYVNETIEWRLKNGSPFATILRWFIENSDSDGSSNKANLGQVLVISKVATPANPSSCVVGYVDALANKNANLLAREVADTMTDGFVCRRDTPQYHGKVGPFSGDTNRYFE